MILCDIHASCISLSHFRILTISEVWCDGLTTIARSTWLGSLYDSSRVFGNSLRFGLKIFTVDAGNHGSFFGRFHWPKTGNWVCPQNCHAAFRKTSWIPTVRNSSSRLAYSRNARTLYLPAKVAYQNLAKESKPNWGPGLALCAALRSIILLIIYRFIVGQ